MSPNFMQDELRKRAESGPVAWDLYLQLPEDGGLPLGRLGALARGPQAA